MKKKKKIMLLILAIFFSVVLFSKNDMKYLKKDNKIFYRFSEEESASEFEITDADFDSFVILNEIYAKDKASVYYKGHKIDFSDSGTFKILSDSVGADKNRVFYKGETNLIKNIDVKNLKIVNDYYLEDDNYYYGLYTIKYGNFKIDGKEMANKVLVSDTSKIRKTQENFRIEDEYLFLSDKVYYLGNEIKNIDLKTFKLLKNGISKDRNSVYKGTVNLKYINQKYSNINVSKFENIGANYYSDGVGIYVVYDDNLPLPIRNYGIFLDTELKITKDTEVLGKNYIFNNGNIHYISEKLDKVDMKTFEILNNGFSKDKNYVYFENGIVNGANSEYFEILGYKFSKDEKNIYYRENLYLEATPKEVTVFSEAFLVADEYVYILGKEKIKNKYVRIIDDKFILINDKIYYWIPEQGVHSFKVKNPLKFKNIGYGYYSDNSGIYYYDKKIIDADPRSFRVINKTFTKDRSNIYYRGNKLKDIDSSTFKILNEYYTKDKNGVYIDYCYNNYSENCEIENYLRYGVQIPAKIEEADLETFKIDIIEPENAKDKNNKYKMGKIVK